MSDNLLEDFDVQRGLRIWPARMKVDYDMHCGGDEEIELAVENRGFAFFHWLADSQWAAEMEKNAHNTNDDHSVTLQTWLDLDDFAAAVTSFCSTLDLPEVEAAIQRWQAKDVAVVYLGARPSRIWVAEQHINELQDWIRYMEDRIRELEEAGIH